MCVFFSRVCGSWQTGNSRESRCRADFRDGGGYYIDVGCSRLIADGKVKIKQGVEIEKLTKDGILFKDGVELKADISTLRVFLASLPSHLC